ncbi:MAG: VWA domain-containing protein [Candidatus Heimdallarchaeota archaeon]|nr:MAG: VWA domain-containing protein [Candidatus Heimdallarchaeota archaeon]
MLRFFGLPISPDETITAQRAYMTLGAQEKETLRLGLRASIVKKREDLHIFDTAFEAFFNQHLIRIPPIHDAESYERARRRFLERLPDERYQELGELLLENQIDQATHAAGEMIGIGIIGSSSQVFLDEYSNLLATLRSAFNLSFGVKVPIRDLTPTQRQSLSDRTIEIAATLQLFEQRIKRNIQKKLPDEEVLSREEHPADFSSIDSFLYQDLNAYFSVTNIKEQLIEIGRILASREKRRRKRAKFGKLDFRRTFRKNLANNGTPLDLVQKRRRIQDPEIVILNDVSGSTRWAADWFFVITYAAQKVFKKIRIFEFDNTMVEVTDALKRKTIDRALEERTECWKNTLRKRRIHSDYQSSLEDFITLMKYRPLTRRTTVLILGDCRDFEGMWFRAKPASAELIEKITLPAKRVIILNPEDKKLWNTGDSVVDHYRNAGAEIFHVASLNDLIRFVFELKHN